MRGSAETRSALGRQRGQHWQSEGRSDWLIFSLTPRTPSLHLLIFNLGDAALEQRCSIFRIMVIIHGNNWEAHAGGWTPQCVCSIWYFPINPRFHNLGQSGYVKYFYTEKSKTTMSSCRTLVPLQVTVPQPCTQMSLLCLWIALLVLCSANKQPRLSKLQRLTWIDV